MLNVECSWCIPRTKPSRHCAVDSLLSRPPDAMNTFMPRTFAILLTLSTTTIFAQAPRTNAPPPIYRFDVEPHWFARDGETNRFWYRVGLPRGESEFILVNAEAGTRAPAFDHARLARALAEKTGQPVDARKLPFENIRFSSDGQSVRLLGTNTAWQLDLNSYQVTESS